MHQKEFNWLLNGKFIKWLTIGLVAVFAFTFFLTSSVIIRPLYRSEAIIYVPLTLFSQQYEQQGIGFASDAEIDGHIQMLKSTQLLDSLNAIYGLADVYGIDITQPGGLDNLYNRISDRISIQKTRYGSVSISVMHEDAQTAADMANEIVRLGDVIKNDLLMDNRLEAYRFAKDLYESKRAEIDAIEQRLAAASVPEHAGQDGFSTQMTRKRVGFEAELWELTERRNRYEMMRKSLEMDLPSSYRVTPAIAAGKPSWPPRILFASVAALAFALVFVFVEMIRKDARSTS